MNTTLDRLANTLDHRMRSLKFHLAHELAHLCAACAVKADADFSPHKPLSALGAPSMPELDARGGLHALCDGYGRGAHMVHVDHRGRPFDPLKAAEIASARRANEDQRIPVAGHTLIR